MSHSEIKIDAGALRHNLKKLYELSGRKALFPVIKANAYGHGLTNIAHFFESNFSSTQVPYLCVARFSEARQLRLSGLQRRLLVLSEYQAEDLATDVIEDVDFVVSRMEDLDILTGFPARSQGFHLNINTGMNRLGFDFRRLDQHMDTLSLKLHGLVARGWQWKGIMTHLARGEEEASLFSQTQSERFQESLGVLKTKLSSRGLAWPEWIHVSNSGGILRGVAQNPQVNACRPGIHLWGAHADLKDQGHFDLKAVLSCGAAIRQVRHVKAGEAVGYGGTFISSRDRIIGTVNLGYADGVPRTLSRRENDPWKIGMVVDGVRVPFVGIISMDMCMIDLSEHPRFVSGWQEDASTGRAYWICPEQRSEEIAETLGTIPYEVFCALSARLRREMVDPS